MPHGEGASHSGIDLEQSTLGELQRRATDCGVDPRNVYAAIDSSAPKDTLIKLILEAKNPTSAEAREHAARVHAKRRAEHKMEELRRDELAGQLDQARDFAGTLRKGQQVCYFDLQVSTWLSAVVEFVHKDSYHVDLCSKDWCRPRRVDALRIRRVTALEEEEHREQHTRFQIGEHVQYFNQPSADWIEAVITDVMRNATGRVNGVDVSVCYSKHWPVEDVAVPRVPPKQIRKLTKQRAADETERSQARWNATLSEDDIRVQGVDTVPRHDPEPEPEPDWSSPLPGDSFNTEGRRSNVASFRGVTSWGVSQKSDREQTPSPVPMPARSDSESE